MNRFLQREAMLARYAIMARVADICFAAPRSDYPVSIMLAI